VKLKRTTSPPAPQAAVQQEVERTDKGCNRQCHHETVLKRICPEQEREGQDDPANQGHPQQASAQDLEPLCASRHVLDGQPGYSGEGFSPHHLAFGPRSRRADDQVFCANFDQHRHSEWIAWIRDRRRKQTRVHHCAEESARSVHSSPPCAIRLAR
jgi:hypothetical protein